MRHPLRLLLGISVAAALALPLRGSSHREAPLITEDPVADNTDVYAFVSPDRPSTVTLIANFIPLEEPAGGPNFYKFGDNVGYEIVIDNNGDARPDIVYRFDFKTQVQNANTFLYNTGPITSLADGDFNIRQTYTVTRWAGGVSSILGSDLETPPVNIGPRSTGDTSTDYQRLAAEAVHTLVGGATVFAGQRDDPFFVDLGSVFDLLGLRPFNAAHLIPLANERGKDGLAGFNVHTIALQIPKHQLTSDGSGATDPKNTTSIIAVYARATRPRTTSLSPTGAPPAVSTTEVQVSRLGMPLVNEVLIPLGKKDLWNASQPINDAQFAAYVRDPEPARLIHLLYPTISVPPAPRTDLVAIFLTGIPGLNQPVGVVPADGLRLNMAIPPSATPNRLGLLAGQSDGFPNGRRLGDDVVDIELRALAGGTPFTPAFNHAPNNTLSDGVNANDKFLLSSFPYVPRPHSGYAHIHDR
jgi:Domain of unknown function (DUF4331)